MEGALAFCVSAVSSANLSSRSGSIASAASLCAQAPVNELTREAPTRFTCSPRSFSSTFTPQNNLRRLLQRHISFEPVRPYVPVQPKAVVNSNDIRNGTAIVIDTNLYKVLEFMHVKPGKGAAFVRTKLKNMATGTTVEKTFRAGETLDTPANLEKREMQHTYKEGEDFIFMDMESYEEGRLSEKEIGSGSKYIYEGMTINVLTWDGKVLDVELPNTIELEVADTEPGVKGNTATNATKAAIMSTGASIQVPLFINIGEKIRIDTRTDSYLGRA